MEKWKKWKKWKRLSPPLGKRKKKFWQISVGGNLILNHAKVKFSLLSLSLSSLSFFLSYFNFPNSLWPTRLHLDAEVITSSSVSFFSLFPSKASFIYYICLQTRPLPKTGQQTQYSSFPSSSSFSCFGHGGAYGFNEQSSLFSS